MIVVNICIPLAAWAFLVFKSPAIREGGDERAKSLWLFALYFALATTLRVDELYILVINHATGIPYLSLLLTYLTLILAIYFIYINSCAISKTKQPKWAVPLTVIIGGLLVVIFPFVMQAGWPTRRGTMMFQAPLYFYAGVLAVLTFRNHNQVYRNEKTMATRVRFFIATTASASAAAYFAIRLGTSIIDFVTLSDERAANTAILKYLLALAGLIWPWVFVSNAVYKALGGLVTHLKKMGTLKGLQNLQKKLHCLCDSSSIIPQRCWWTVWPPDMNLQLYWATIDILDHRKTLKHKLRKAEHQWSLTTQKQAERLSQALDGLQDSSDLDQLAQELQRRNR